MTLPPQGWYPISSDPLTNGSAPTSGEKTGEGGSCWFDENGTYRVRETTDGVAFACGELGLEFSDFAVELEAEISGQGCFDMVFRDGKQGPLYAYSVCTTGHASARRSYAQKQDEEEKESYTLFTEDNVEVAENDPFKVGIVAIGSRLHFFLEGKMINAAPDSASLSGKFYLRAWAAPGPVTVGFRDFKAWTP